MTAAVVADGSDKETSRTGSTGAGTAGSSRTRSISGYLLCSASAEAERARALQTAREAMTNNRSQSVIGNYHQLVFYSNFLFVGPHPTLSRENSGVGGQRSYSMVHASYTGSFISFPALFLLMLCRSDSEWV